MQMPMWRVYEARDGDWIPFDRMIRVDHNSPEYQSHKLADSFYSQAWLTVHYGMVENREFGKQMFQFLNLAQQPACRSTRRPLPRSVRISASSTSNCATTRARPACLGRHCDRRGARGDAASPQAGGGARRARQPHRHHARPRGSHPIASGRWWSRWQRREPASARAAIFAARLAQAQDDEAAFGKAIAQAETALAPTDFAARRELASVLLATALDFGPLSKLSTRRHGSLPEARHAAVRRSRRA